MISGGGVGDGGVAGALDLARQVADTVMYEGYVLFPYRASALKNRYRWQWGVVIPHAQTELGAAEPSALQCELLVRAPAGTVVDVSARFLHLRLRQMFDGDGRPVDELVVDGDPVPTWEEGLEREVTLRVTLGVAPHRQRRFTVPGARERERCGEAGHAVRTTEPLQGELAVDIVPGDACTRLRISVHNHTPWSLRRAPRDAVLRRALVGVHVLARTRAGTFASAIDPPPWARGVDLHHRGLHPVLVGDDDAVVLAAPIILYDHPRVAPESPGPSFDATEVDELLALCVLGLSEEEQRRARATDPRAAELIERTATLPDAVHRRLHGTVRALRPADAEPAPEADVSDDVRALLGVGEEPVRSVVVAGTSVEVGARVRLRPRRRADAHDLFADGRVALVERIVRTVEGDTYLAVTIDDDPAAELHRWYGRFQYFGSDEVEPLPGPQAPAASGGQDERQGG